MPGRLSTFRLQIAQRLALVPNHQGSGGGEPRAGWQKFSAANRGDRRCDRGWSSHFWNQRVRQIKAGLIRKNERATGKQTHRISIYGLELLGAQWTAFQIPLGAIGERLGGRRNKTRRRLQPRSAWEL